VFCDEDDDEDDVEVDVGLLLNGFLKIMSFILFVKISFNRLLSFASISKIIQLQNSLQN